MALNKNTENLIQQIVTLFKLNPTNREIKKLRYFLKLYNVKRPPRVTYHNKKPKRTLNDICKQVCKTFQISVYQLKAKSPVYHYYHGKRRYRIYVNARVCFSQLATEAGHSQVAIGNFLQLHRTTIIHYLSGNIKTQ